MVDRRTIDRISPRGDGHPGWDGIGSLAVSGRTGRRPFPDGCRNTWSRARLALAFQLDDGSATIGHLLGLYDSLGGSLRSGLSLAAHAVCP